MMVAPGDPRQFGPDWQGVKEEQAQAARERGAHEEAERQAPAMRIGMVGG
jgi:hypothetical protein